MCEQNIIHWIISRNGSNTRLYSLRLSSLVRIFFWAKIFGAVKKNTVLDFYVTILPSRDWLSGRTLEENKQQKKHIKYQQIVINALKNKIPQFIV